MAKVEIVYVDAQQQVVHITSVLQEKTTVAQALQASGLWDLHPDTKNLAIGIFSNPVTLETLVQPGDRIEIYREMPADPKTKRRQRARVKANAKGR